MKNPFKKANKSKAQINYEQKQLLETNRKRLFVEEKFLPLLRNRSTTVHQAKQMCKILQNDILSTFNEGMRKPVSTLGLDAKIEGQKDEASEIFRELIQIFSDISIAEAAELIGGMPQAIEAAFAFEERNHNMNDLEWVDGTLKLKKV